MFFPSPLIPYPTTIGKIQDSLLLHHHPDLKHPDDSQTKMRHSILNICLKFCSRLLSFSFEWQAKTRPLTYIAR